MKIINSHTKMADIEDSKLLILYDSWLAKIQRLFNRIFRKQYVGIVNPFTTTIHVSDYEYFDKLPFWFIKHGFIHIMQIITFGRFRFTLFYIIYSIRYGLDNNPFEDMAFIYQMNFDYNALKSYITDMYHNRYKLIIRK